MRHTAMSCFPFNAITRCTGATWENSGANGKNNQIKSLKPNFRQLEQVGAKISRAFPERGIVDFTHQDFTKGASYESGC
jgi:hypothetical protein